MLSHMRRALFIPCWLGMVHKASCILEKLFLQVFEVPSSGWACRSAQWPLLESNLLRASLFDVGVLLNWLANNFSILNWLGTKHRASLEERSTVNSYPQLEHKSVKRAEDERLWNVSLSQHDLSRCWIYLKNSR